MSNTVREIGEREVQTQEEDDDELTDEERSKYRALAARAH